MKYSMPLPEEPSRFARQIVITRGKLRGSSGSSPAKCSRSAFSSSTTYSLTGLPARAASSVRSSGLRSKAGCDGVQPIRDACASVSAKAQPVKQTPAEWAGQLLGAEALITPLVAVQVEERGARHVPGRALPVQPEGHRLETGQRTDLFLTDVMRPAAAVDALAAAQHREGEERAIDLVGVEPMVGARTHRDHRAALGQLRVTGELPRHPGRSGRGHGGDRLLPCRCVGLRVVIAGRPLTRQPYT